VVVVVENAKNYKLQNTIIPQKIRWNFIKKYFFFTEPRAGDWGMVWALILAELS
jgi:hypothetical protein